MRLGAIVLQSQPWTDARSTWQQVEHSGFDVGYVADHLTHSTMAGQWWADGWTTLAAAAQVTARLQLGTLVASAAVRNPAALARAAATLHDLSNGRFVLGLGASSPVIVGNWNGIAFEEPYRRTRDVLRAVRTALAGQRVDGTFDTFTVQRFKLEQAPTPPPPILLAALRPQMLALAGTLLHEPDVLLIDELSLGLSPIMVQQLLGVVEQLKEQGITIVIVEQSLNVALAMADRALACSAAGSPETVRREIAAFVARHAPDELILTAQIHDHAARLRSFEIAAEILREPVAAG